MKEKIKNLLNRIPYVKDLHKHRAEFLKNSCYPPGHYYSPIISVDEIKSRQNVIWAGCDIDGIDGINLKTQDQINLVHNFEQYYDDIPFEDDKKEQQRYYFKNKFYSYTDSIFLYSMIRHLNPKNIIEVGSGFSSSVMLDTNEIFNENQINLTFIEPYPERLNSLLKESDKNNVTIIQSKVQDVSIDQFRKLNSGDILFIDSTHVSKTGSDVNHIIFNILPILKSGVHIHFHDIFYPFEYPKEWVFNGRNWNEDYLIKSFLMYNNTFEIKLFADYLHKHHKELFKTMPLCYKNHGGNLWIEKK